MSVALLTRPPTPDELARLRLAMSTFCDGSGQERSSDGTTRPGWRELERIVAEVFGGYGPENKCVFDIFVNSSTQPEIDYGISLKSKELSRRSALADLEHTGRVYMELSNSPAKFWDALKQSGLSENDFRSQRRAADFGKIVLGVVLGWHAEAQREHALQNPKRTLDLTKSCFLVISYNKPRSGEPRKYQLHSFDLSFPSGISWKFHSGRCLRGFDPLAPEEPLIDWYGLSGGQLKYYPRAATARFCSATFSLLALREMSISEKAARYWPKEFLSVGGQQVLTNHQLAEEIERLSLLASDPTQRR